MKKKFTLTMIFLLTLTGLCRAQREVRLNGYATYAFDDKFDTYYSSTEYIEGKIKGGLLWGVGIEVNVRENTAVELIYFRQDTEAPIRFYYLGDRDRTIELGVNYIMLAGVRSVQVSDKIEPYGGLMLGAAIFSNKDPQGDESDSATKFAWGLRIGTNIWISEKVGIKLQAQLLSAVQALGGGLYVGTGGAGAGVSSYSTLLQFGLGGGLVVKVK
jgi:opacity protein-like surface antigen